MSKRPAYRILIGGGGTGGHVFPAIAIADALKQKHPDMEFLFVGALGKLEMEKVPEAGYAIEGLPVAGWTGAQPTDCGPNGCNDRPFGRTGRPAGYPFPHGGRRHSRG